MWRRTFLLGLCGALAFTQDFPKISPDARVLGGILGIDGTLRELLNAAPSDDIHRLKLRQQLTEAVIEASLDADSVIADIQMEEGQLQSVENYLSSRRDKAVNLANFGAALVGSGVGVAGTAMQFSSKTAIAGDVVGVVAGSAATALTIAAIRIQRGGRMQLGATPNMLAAFFGERPGLHSRYPEDVWAYLNVEPAAEVRQGTRREQLMEEWVRAGMIRGDGSVTDRNKIEFLTSGISSKTRLNLSELSDREAMLGGVRARVALMKRDLADLMHTVRQAGW